MHMHQFLYPMHANTWFSMPKLKFLLCIGKIYIVFSSNTLITHLGVTIKLIFKFINLNIPMFSENINAFEGDHNRFKLRSNQTNAFPAHDVLVMIAKQKGDG